MTRDGKNKCGTMCYQGVNNRGWRGKDGLIARNNDKWWPMIGNDKRLWSIVRLQGGSNGDRKVFRLKIK
jgi:hypothetical protein